MLTVHHIFAGYGSAEVLHDISFTAQQSGITTVIGRNGCGKSTLLKAICGILPVSGGEILLDESSITELSPNERARKIAYLAQGKNTPDITAGRMVLHGRFPYLTYPRRYSKTDYEVAGSAMARLGLSEYTDTPIAQLSGGTRQKVYIAMALAQCAPVILMDEPTSYLDIGQQVKLAGMTRELAAQGKTVLLVLHDLLLALKLSDRICVMADGRMLMQDTPDAVLHSGILQSLYGVRVHSLQTEDGIQYYYQL